MESLRSGKEGTPASLVEPRRGLWIPKRLRAGAGGGGSAPGSSRWSRFGGPVSQVSSLVAPMGLSAAQLLLVLSHCLSLSGLLTTPTPGSPASSGLLTAPLLLLLPLFLPFLRPLSLLGLPASWRGARTATAAAGAAAVAAAAAAASGTRTKLL